MHFPDWKPIARKISSRNWWLLIGWVPYFVLLALSLDWRWSNVRREFGIFIDMISGRHLYISVTPWGPQPHADICCRIWAVIAVFTAVYCGIIRLIDLRRKRKNYPAFAIPFAIIVLYVSYLWLWAYYVLNSYIHQLGMTPAREKGFFCLMAGLVLWLAYAALLGYPWERRAAGKTPTAP